MNSITTPRQYTKFIGLKSIFYFCSLPIRIDAYRGCAIGCRYCFSRHLNNRKTAFSSDVVPADPDKLRRLLAHGLAGGKNRGLISSCLQRRMPLHLGCLSDPLQPLESVKRVTKQFLEILADHNYPIVFSTKSDMVARPPYLRLLHKLPISVQVSFSTLDQTLAGQLEPNAPTPAKRLLALRRLADSGIHTTARLQPFLYPVEEVSYRTFSEIAKAGVRHVILEHLRIPTNSAASTRRLLWQALKIDMIQEFARRGSKYSRVSYELSSEVKYQNVTLAKRMIHELGMTFGAGDNDLHHLSDHPCCCGVPRNTEFKNIYRGHLGISAFNSIRKGEIDLSNIEKEWHPEGGIREYLNSDCRIEGINSVRGMLKYKIDHIRSSNSLASFFGIDLDKSNAYFVSDRNL